MPYLICETQTYKEENEDDEAVEVEDNILPMVDRIELPNALAGPPPNPLVAESVVARRRIIYKSKRRVAVTTNGVQN